ncbi:MAG: 6-phosphofructokinase, partial [Candidatus Thorarchaeota archaeon]
MRVVVLTSGGDSPGMNACVRAIVRVGINRGIKIFGVPGGYQGILDGEFNRLTARWVANIMHRGGTHLTTGRS